MNGQGRKAPGYSIKTYTGGEFRNEKEAVQRLLTVLKPYSLSFGIQQEVRGWFIHPRPGVPPKTARIDMILTPKKILIEAGWTHGPIGIECKRSDVSIGKAISQSLDYTHAAFKLNGNFATIIPEWVFIWPVNSSIFGDVASIMHHNKVGTLCEYKNGLLFKAGGVHAIYLQPGQPPVIHHIPCGNKIGSR